MPRARGVTLLELLLAMTILGVVLTILLQYFISGLRVTANITDQTRLQEELRAAGNIITDEVQRALYVFPPGTSFSLNAGDFGSISNYLRDPKSNNPIWQVGAASNAPILAMIVAPKDPSVACAKFSEGCYEFVTYHPVKREYLVRGQHGNPNDSRAHLEPDTTNDDRWVLIEYRRKLDKNLNPENGDELQAVNTTTTWTISENTITVRVPRVPWATVGCGNNPPLTQPCPSFAPQPPVPDLSIQNKASAIPAICRNADQSRTLSHRKRMQASRIWLEKNPGEARILFEHIKPGTGFTLEYPGDALDERGVSEVRLTLQAGFKTRGTEVLVPGVALEFYSSPRNISSPTLQCSP